MCYNVSIYRLEFCSKPEHRSRTKRDLLPDNCFQRVRGLLFFNRNTPVSNNKLKILLDTGRDLSDALSGASTARRNLPHTFRQWLEECHRSYDKEVCSLSLALLPSLFLLYKVTLNYRIFTILILNFLILN